jgi:hypothetical protein
MFGPDFMSRPSLLLQILCACCLLFSCRAEKHLIASRFGGRANPSPIDNLQIDLGYTVYKGYYDSKSRLKIWQG